MTTQTEGMEIDKEMESLRADAAAADAGLSNRSAATEPDHSASGDETPADDKDKQATDSQRSDTRADNSPEPEGDKEKAKPDSQTPPKPDGTAGDPKPNESQESPYAGKKRGAKERIEELARENRTYKEQLEIKERELAEIKKGSAKPAPDSGEASEKKPTAKNDPYPQYTMEELEKFAEDFERDGDTAMATKCRTALVAKAKAIAASRQEDTQTARQRAHEEFSAGWKKTLAELVKADPELEKDTYPVTQEVKKLLDHKDYGRFFLAFPDGARAAVEVAKLRMQAARVSGLEKQVAELTKEKQRLEKLTAINGAPSTQQEGDKKFEEMTTEEQDAYLRREAARADA